jgi:hypothetical protein
MLSAHRFLGAAATALASSLIACRTAAPVPKPIATTEKSPPKVAPPASAIAATPSPPERAPTYGVPVPDAAEWLARHALVGTTPGECYEVQAGVPPLASLLCRETNARNRSQDGPKTFERIYRPNGRGRVTEVWRGIVRIDSNWLDLVVSLSADGARLELEDRTPCRCERALREDREKRESEVQPDGLSRNLHLACAARGTYVWKEGEYVRERSERARCREGEVDLSEW